MCVCAGYPSSLAAGRERGWDRWRLVPGRLEEVKQLFLGPWCAPKESLVTDVPKHCPSGNNLYMYEH
jgi:hypothetical protein